MNKQGIKKHLRLVAAAGVAAALFPVAGASAHSEPTCHDVLGSGIENHGQHIVGDYVTGLGAVVGDQLLEWPPAGQVGEAMRTGGGAAIPGGPGPGFHFELGLAPGASFCNENAHPNGFDVPENVPTPGNPS